MGTAQALVAAAAVLAMSGGGRHLLEVFLPNQVLRIPVRGNPPLPPAVNVRVVGECANGQYGKLPGLPLILPFIWSSGNYWNSCTAIRIAGVVRVLEVIYTGECARYMPG